MDQADKKHGEASGDLIAAYFPRSELIVLRTRVLDLP